MDALQYVHIPGYSALILRKNYTLLSKSGAIMDRARAWLVNKPGVSWNEQKKTFRFKTDGADATIQFGFIERPIEWMLFQGTEYHRIYWDELTEFRLEPDDENNPYLCMNRSQRAAPPGVDIAMVSASNPGNIGHRYVKEFIIGPDASAKIANGANEILEGANGHKVLPSRIDDNPAVNPEEYREKLMLLPPITRARLLNGDWDASESRAIPADWILTYASPGDYLQLLTPDGETTSRQIPTGLCKRFATIDTAGTSRDKAEAKSGKPASWSVCAIWDYWSAADVLFLRHVWRKQVAWNELRTEIPTVLNQFGVKKVRIENAHFGQPLAAELRGFETSLVGPMLPGMQDGYRGAKYERAVSSGLLTRLEQGKLRVPAESKPWVGPYIRELTDWDGSAEAVSDQIDVSSYAAWECRGHGASWGGVVRSTR